jgi:hypothetical protein
VDTLPSSVTCNLTNYGIDLGGYLPSLAQNLVSGANFAPLTKFCTTGAVDVSVGLGRETARRVSRAAMRKEWSGRLVLGGLNRSPDTLWRGWHVDVAHTEV